jgi:uncharacterized protein YraI
MAVPSALHGAEPDWFRVDGVSPVRVLWVRSGPAVTFKRIGFLRHDARHIQNLGCQQLAGGTWCRIRYRRTEGWVSRNFLARDTRFKA